MYQFLSSANKCMVQSQQPTPSPLSQLPNTAVCLVCTIVPLLWLSGRFASLANGSGAELPLTCRWFAYRQTLEIREEPACRKMREKEGKRNGERERRRAARQWCGAEGKQRQREAPCSGSHSSPLWKWNGFLSGRRSNYICTLTAQSDAKSGRIGTDDTKQHGAKH